MPGTKGRGHRAGSELVDTPIKVGVVGLGVFGNHHARHYAANSGAELVAVVDRDASRATTAAATHGAAMVLTDHRDLIGKVQAVSVTSPAESHHAVAAELAAAGIHILVEKPLATTADDARTIVATAERSGSIVAVGHVERFSPVTRALRERVRKPRRIATVRHSVWNGRSTDVDVILDLMIHDIDLVLSLAQAPVASVAASGVVGRSGRMDEVEAWLTFADGLVATLSASRVADANSRKLSITEPDTTYAADLSAVSLAVASRSRWGASSEAVAMTPSDNLGAEIADFLGAIAEGRAPEIDGSQGIRAVEIANRIQAAAAETASPKREALA